QVAEAKEASCTADPSSYEMPRFFQSSRIAAKEKPDAPLDKKCNKYHSFQDGQKINLTLGTHCEEIAERHLTYESNVSTLNSQDWSSTAYSSRIMQFFSTPPKHVSTNSQKPPLQSSSAWSNLSSLRVMGSFRKLRSSVLQGIQSQADAMVPSPRQENDTLHHQSQVDVINPNWSEEDVMLCSKSHEDNVVDNKEQGVRADGARNDGSQKLLNGISAADKPVWNTSEMCGTEGESEGEAMLYRKSHFSHSIRRAYGWGRIALTSAGQQSPGDSMLLNKADVCVPYQEPVEITNSGRMLNQRSRSTDSLLKSPFKSKAPCIQPETHVDGDIQRAASASSLELQGNGLSQLKSHMRKLVSSMTELSTRKKASPSAQPGLSAVSKLHDAYSRRAACRPENERQRRPSPARGAHIPSVSERVGRQKSPVQSTVSPVIHQVFVTDGSQQVTCHNGETANICRSPTQRQPTTEPSRPVPKHSSCAEGLASLSTGLEEDQAENGNISEIVPEDEEMAVQPAHTPPSVLPSNTPDCFISDSRGTPDLDLPTAQHQTASDAEAPLASIARHKLCRSKPRPISDYGQLLSRKLSIAEEEKMGCQSQEIISCWQEEYSSKNNCVNSSQESCRSDGSDGISIQETCSSNGGHHSKSKDHWRRRPISVIGGVHLYSSSVAGETEDVLPLPELRPPMPPHQVSPYRDVSSQLYPGPLSLSTPTGLDRLGRRQVHRVLSTGAAECSGTLEETVSEEDCSFDELPDPNLSLQPGVELSALNEWLRSGRAVYAEALWDHVTMEEEELAFKAGDVIRVLDASDKDWWWGVVTDQMGWFPSSFVRVRVNQELQVDSVTNKQAPGSPLSSDTCQRSELRNQMRANVVKEIMSTERIYMKHLKDICEGYIRQCRKHTAMFTPQQLNTIFSNIEDIYKFHRKFLKDLEKKYNKNEPHLSEIGSCFLLQGEGFSIYSEYCNNHPRATAELHRLMKLGRYRHFFEACRLLQQMIDISLAGFLLTPVQKICKYPLQLGELLKYTHEEHRDYKSVSDALDAMKTAARLINERKRRLESIDTIAHWQVTILHWEGDDVLARSSELIHSGELSRVFRHGKTQQRTFFLFDHQLVFCKKDLLRRDLLHYRGRLDMDRMELQDLPDGRDADLGACVKHAFKLQDRTTGETCILSSRKPEEKQRWLEALRRERQRVIEDQEIGMEISEHQRKQAILNARKSKRGNMKGAVYVGCAVPLPHQPLHPLHQRHVTVPTSLAQQRVFSLAEPRRKPFYLWHSLAQYTRSRK
ncbi:spermatogenesis-associated protein 13-like, partial [Arapaima gigas]